MISREGINKNKNSFRCLLSPLFYGSGRFPFNAYNIKHTNPNATRPTAADWGRMAKAPDASTHRTAVSVFTAFTFSRMALARLGSSIFFSPFPSTAHNPNCAIFHKPVSAESLYPTVKNNGITVRKRRKCPPKSPSSANTADQMA